MRASCVVLGVLGLGCVQRTVAVEDIAVYARDEVVVAREGYPLRRKDGGKVAPVSRPGVCLHETGTFEAEVRGRVVQVAELEPREGGRNCRSPSVLVPVQVQVDDGTLTMIGRGGGIRVATANLDGLRITKPFNAPTDWAPASELRSVPLVVIGAVLAAGGVAGSIPPMVAQANVDEGDGFMHLALAGLSALSLVVGVGGGVTMIVFGAQPVRGTVEQAPR